MGENRASAKVAFGLTVLLGLGALLGFAWAENLFARALRHEMWGWLWLGVLGLDGMMGLGWAARVFLQKPWRVPTLKNKWVRWGLGLLVAAVFPYLVLYSAYTGQFADVGIRFLVYLNFSLVVAWLLAPSLDERGAALVAFLRGALLTGAVFAFAAAYTQVSSFPFRLTWSEGNRLWDYSLKFARGRYLYPADQPLRAHIDPGRQLLWGLIFLVPGVNIFWVRFWSAFLFSVPYLLFAWVVFLKPRATRSLAFWAGLWGFLFLNQGPIYTPLLLSALGVAVAEMGLPWWLGFPLMAGAAYYAAITRYTWIFAPALWALILVWGTRQKGDDWRTALRGKAWWLLGGGLSGALLSGRWHAFSSIAWAFWEKYLGLGASGASEGGQAPAMVGISVRQPLIWSRLWPNPTFAPGILLGILLAVGPVFLLWWVWHRHGVWALPRWAMLGIGAILAALLGVGVIISLKIGGGSNLHNLDMFLLAVVFGTVALWRQGGAQWLRERQWQGWEGGVLVALVMVPMYFIFLFAHPRNIPEARWWEPALRAVQHFVREAKASGGEILFMDQRQLLTFGYVEEVPLVPEYEKKLMMDKAMAGDARYFAHYYWDLAHHRFALIVTEPLNSNQESENQNDFASENNAWVKWVSKPTLCFYEPKATFKAVQLQLLVPRQDTSQCLSELPVPPAP